MDRSERAKALADDWISWLDDHRFFGPPEKKSILAQLVEKAKRKGEPPDRPLNAELAAFHVAVMGLEIRQFQYFIRVYCGYPFEPVKTLACEAGVSRETYYQRAHEAAHQVLGSMASVMAMVENLGILQRQESVRFSPDKIVPDKRAGFPYHL